jgi:hypothetical protein
LNTRRHWTPALALVRVRVDHLHSDPFSGNFGWNVFGRACNLVYIDIESTSLYFTSKERVDTTRKLTWMWVFSVESCFLSSAIVVVFVWQRVWIWWLGSRYPTLDTWKYPMDVSNSQEPCYVIKLSIQTFVAFPLTHPANNGQNNKTFGKKPKKTPV